MYICTSKQGTTGRFPRPKNWNNEKEQHNTHIEVHQQGD